MGANHATRPARPAGRSPRVRYLTRHAMPFSHVLLLQPPQLMLQTFCGSSESDDWCGSFYHAVLDTNYWKRHARAGGYSIFRRWVNKNERSTLLHWINSDSLCTPSHPIRIVILVTWLLWGGVGRFFRGVEGQVLVIQDVTGSCGRFPVRRLKVRACPVNRGDPWIAGGVHISSCPPPNSDP